jgi:predicted acyltransferase
LRLPGLAHILATVRAGGSSLMASPAKTRVPSLDVHRGLAVIAMMLVDWTGSWDVRHDIFEHAQWLGITPPDFIFPSLLFIMGVAIPLSLTPERLRDTPRGRLWLGIFRRAVLLFAFGYLLNIFWVWEPSGRMPTRILGVLQRYAIIYPIVAALHVRLSTRALGLLGLGGLLVYWAVLVWVPVPGFGAPNLTLFPAGETTPNLAAWIDRTLLGHHMGSSYPQDPEGILSTVPAIVTSIIGVVAGRWLRREGDAGAKLNHLFAWGVGLALAGYLWGFAFPMSKKLWTSSFVLYTGGWSLLLLAALQWLSDRQRWRAFTAVAGYFGGNALLAIMLFTFIDNLLRVLPVGRRPDRSVFAVKDFIYERLLQPTFSAKNAAWVYSVLGIGLLVPLFRWLSRRRLFLRV